MKYIVTGTSSGPYGTEERPTQESFKSFGEGQYAIRRADGSISKNITVSVNRNGNLKVVGTNPEGLDAISTLVLGRMVRAYAVIVKAWPKSQSAKEYKRVVDEVQARATLVGTVAPRSAEVTEMEASGDGTKIKTKPRPQAQPRAPGCRLGGRIMTAPAPEIFFPIETRPADATRDLQRRNAALAKEQDKREPVVNSIEHNATVFVADVEKVAATTKLDTNGQPVFRRTYADNGEGIPIDTMALLLRHPGTSSKPQDIFSGNHGMGVTVANGFNNLYGMPVISKTLDRENPHMAIFKVVKDSEGRDVGSLVPFWVEDEDGSGSWEPVIELFAGQGATWDGMDWYEVWKAAYDNPKFKSSNDENGLPTSGVLIVECGRHKFDSTFTSTQTIQNQATGEWEYSRWAGGQYWNGRFWDFDTIRPSAPIGVFWGVPGPDFDWTFGERQKNMPFKRGTPSFNGSKEWQYRSATGLREQIHLTVEDDDETPATTTKPTPTVTTDDHSYPDCIVPFSVEVYIRELPPGVEARKLNFQVRRQGKIFVDFGGEIFDHPSPQPDSFGQFGLSEKIIRENVWLRIIPHHFGAVAGGVWMEDGRKDLSVYVRDGDSIEFPWREVAKAFRHSMPTKLIEYIKALDADIDPNHLLNDKRLRKLWQRVAKSFNKAGRATPKKKKRPIQRATRRWMSSLRARASGRTLTAGAVRSSTPARRTPRATARRRAVLRARSPRPRRSPPRPRRRRAARTPTRRSSCGTARRASALPRNGRSRRAGPLCTTSPTAATRSAARSICSGTTGTSSSSTASGPATTARTPMRPTTSWCRSVRCSRGRWRPRSVTVSRRSSRTPRRSGSRPRSWTSCSTPRP